MQKESLLLCLHPTTLSNLLYNVNVPLVPDGETCAGPFSYPVLCVSDVGAEVRNQALGLDVLVLGFRA